MTPERQREFLELQERIIDRMGNDREIERFMCLLGDLAKEALEGLESGMFCCPDQEFIEFLEKLR
jgi:hypothetical protein